MKNHIIYKNWKTHVLKIDHQKKIPSIPKFLLPCSRPHSSIQTKVCCPKTENETNNHFPCPCFNSNVMKRDLWKKYQKFIHWFLTKKVKQMNQYWIGNYTRNLWKKGMVRDRFKNPTILKNSLVIWFFSISLWYGKSNNRI